MLLSPFYETFDEYEYMLIAQLDSYIFNDNIDEFINLGYDYIGCLHIGPENNKLVNGNGGLSLRKIKSFVRASKNIQEDLRDIHDFEDILYSYYYKDKLNIAPYSVSLMFGWQQHPEDCMAENNNKLPYGCHKPMIFWKDFKKYIK